MGRNDTSSTAGAWTPTPPSATMKPSVAASEYAGAVEATPITTLERKPIAFFFRPLASTRPVAGAPATGSAGAATVSVAMGLLFGGPRRGSAVVTKVTSSSDGPQWAQSPNQVRL